MPGWKRCGASLLGSSGSRGPLRTDALEFGCFGRSTVRLGPYHAFLGITAYLADLYGSYAAGGLAANTVLRSICGATFALFGSVLYYTLGVPWATSILEFIGVGLAPMPWILYSYGPQIREEVNITFRGENKIGGLFNRVELHRKKMTCDRSSTSCSDSRATGLIRDSGLFRSTTLSSTLSHTSLPNTKRIHD